MARSGYDLMGMQNGVEVDLRRKGVGCGCGWDALVRGSRALAVPF